MRDERLQVFRRAVDELVESLLAVVRLSRWNDAEARPEPLVACASKLLDRLGTADRLAASRFQGQAMQVAKVEAMCTAMKKLDAAYLSYRKQIESSGDSGEAATALELEISATTAASAAWA